MDKKKDYSDQLDEDGRFAQGNQLHKLRENPGRKSKLPRFVEAFACVVRDPHPVGMAIIHTDKDLLRMTNRRLREQGDEKCQVSQTSWENYLRGEVGTLTEEVEKSLQEFEQLYGDALLEQRNNLFRRMTDKDEARSWGRWSWIIERKFDAWNLRKKQVDETPDRKQLVFRVDPGDEDED